MLPRAPGKRTREGNAPLKMSIKQKEKEVSTGCPRWSKKKELLTGTTNLRYLHGRVREVKREVTKASNLDAANK